MLPNHGKKSSVDWESRKWPLQVTPNSPLVKILLVASVGSLLGPKIRKMNSPTERWAIFLNGKVIPIEDRMTEGIQRDPTDIMGWYEEEALVAWKNIFPLTEMSA